ncbi:MAG: N-acetyl-gamma-glutamyl-phosphate reductase [Bacteroidetes bacterium]|nr:N-acetyl-gamma-glutamyl-phosphate reductase [Rhodothermia bacterium]MCX7907545.1 N-acetyl-gamma-glutamyl-phosphate reductase [Bacteroidota bacterium]MDW8284524.1 N-acetyl-gamma-glutamyl-phosphate reductase [Bacteroidota bacterium]
MKRVALLHGSGYAGRELIRLLLGHPRVQLVAVTSRHYAGSPLWAAHPELRGLSELRFVERLDLNGSPDAVFVAAEHGKGAETVRELLQRGYGGAIIDLSADFRLPRAELYPHWFGFTHPAPELVGRFQYGLPELGPYPEDVRWIANPGCFATGILLALWPLDRAGVRGHAHVTALTGASGSGVRPSETTHFPTRQGNVRAYKVLAHQHLPEIEARLQGDWQLAFVPASGPWTRGIWGVIHLLPQRPLSASFVEACFQEAYLEGGCVRLWPGLLPELRWSVGTPYADIGWVLRDGRLVIGFALDNLLKGAASQAVQNLNRLFTWPETLGLIPGSVAEDVTHEL